MNNEKIEFPFKIPRLIKILGIAAFVVLGTIYMRYQMKRDIKDGELFYKADIRGVVEKVGSGSGGWYTIYLTDGRTFRFCPRESYVDRQIAKGDSLIKSSMSDTVFFFNSNRRLIILFLKTMTE